MKDHPGEGGMCPGPQGRSQGGFSLIEVTLAMGLLATVLISIASLFILGGKQVKDGKSMTAEELRREVEYLKAHYPVYFMSAHLSSEADKTTTSSKIIQYISESKKMGIDILPPDINKSRENFRVETDCAVRFGLIGLKNVGSAALGIMLKARGEGGEFKSFNDFVERVANRWTSARRDRPDPSQNLQWGLRVMEWFRVARRPDARDVHVAILDTGVDANHPDLDGVVASYAHDGRSARDFRGHGTHVAGIVGARANNGIGIAGVANCRLHVWKVFADPLARGLEEEFDDEAYNQALAAVLDSPARIVNLSLGGSERSRVEQDLIVALVAEGALVVAAMGNEYDEGNPIEWPAAYDNVLAVGAIGENRRRASFSNTGRHINLVAPGNNILSTLPRYASFIRDETDYAAWPGTSMAAPHVAGVAALVKATHPDRKDFWRVPTLYKTVQDRNVAEKVYEKFPLVMTSGRLTEFEGGGDETRSNPWLAELQQHMFVEINPKDANDRGIKDGQYIWLEGPEGGKIKVKAMVTRRVAPGVVFTPYHFGGWFQGQDLLDKYPEGTAPYVRGDAANTAFTYGYDSVTAMQETKVSLCQITAA